MLSITQYRSNVLGLLASALDSGTWTFSIIDAGLIRALQYACLALPPVEVSLTCVGSREQDVSGVSDLFDIAQVGWPYDEQDGVFHPVRWYWVGTTQIYLVSATPAAGDKLRLRYWKRQTINGLGGATETTVPDALADALAAGAAGYALLTRLRQVGEYPAPPKDTMGVYVRLAGEFIGQMVSGFERRGVANPAWQVGL